MMKVKLTINNLEKSKYKKENINYTKNKYSITMTILITYEMY